MKKYFVSEESACPLDKFELILKNETDKVYVQLDGKTMDLKINTTQYVGKGSVTF